MSLKLYSRNYTHIERQIFLDLLIKYRDIIENKKSDSAALKEKEMAWKRIEESYNNCHLVSQQRSTTQLKKWWSNLKQAQRHARKERLERGIEESNDRDSFLLQSHKELNKEAPPILLSNICEAELAGSLRKESSNSSIGNQALNDDMEILCDPPRNEGSRAQLPDANTRNTSFLDISSWKYASRKQKSSASSISSDRSGLDLQSESLRLALKHEEEVHKLKLAYVMDEVNEKRAHRKRMHELEELSYKKRYELEERAAEAKAQLAELQLKRALANEDYKIQQQ